MSFGWYRLLCDLSLTHQLQAAGEKPARHIDWHLIQDRWTGLLIAEGNQQGTEVIGLAEGNLLNAFFVWEDGYSLDAGSHQGPIAFGQVGLEQAVQLLGRAIQDELAQEQAQALEILENFLVFWIDVIEVGEAQQSIELDAVGCKLLKG